MKAEELRIGNLVLCKNKLWHEYIGGKPLRVSGVKQTLRNKHQTIDYSISFIDESNYSQEYNQFIEFIEPIHLTEEWLVKAGFKKQSSNISDKWHIGENPVTHDWLFSLVWLVGHPTPFYQNGHHQIKYVHQLQNLYFALTGEELTI